jgi:hypothetical protein
MLTEFSHTGSRKPTEVNSTNASGLFARAATRSLIQRLVFLALLSSSSAWAQAGPCSRAAPCPPGYFCSKEGSCVTPDMQIHDISGQYLPSCNSNSDCKPGWNCAHTLRGGGECQWPNIPCSQDLNCSYGHCAHGSCTPPDISPQ